jgi:hypothetical protein
MIGSSIAYELLLEAIKEKHDDDPSNDSSFSPRRIANWLCAGDRFTAPARPTGNTTLFDQPPAGCAAGGAITANHDAAASSDQ